MKKIKFLIMLILVSTMTFAQGNANGRNNGQRPRFNQEEFRQRTEAYITKEANLTEEEAKAFFPLYNEYKDKQRKIHFNIHKLKKQKPAQDTEDAYEELLMNIARLQSELTGLDSAYYKKICKLISAKKFYKILTIEDRMHRRILENYNRGRGQKQGQGPRKK